MIEYDIYEKEDEYKAVRSEGFFCWQALLIGMIKIPFSTVIYPVYKGHRFLALIAFILELSAFVLLFVAGSALKPLAILLMLTSVFGLSIGYYAIQRKIANKYYGKFIAKQHGSSEEQAINDIVKKANKQSQTDAASGAGS